MNAASRDDKRELMISNLEKNLPVEIKEREEKPVKPDEIQDDYEFSRATYRNLVDKSNEAISSMMELAMQSEHPRAFEVLSLMLKNTSEMADKLMDLQKKKKELKSSGPSSAPETRGTNNTAIFIGSTSELQKQLMDKLASHVDHIDNRT